MNGGGEDEETDNREVEVKFAIDPARAKAVIAHLAGGRRPSARRLRSVYYDTADHALRRAGFALRVRADGKGRTQTVKTARPGAVRGQWERQAAAETPDPEFIKTTPAGIALNGAALRPVFTVDVARSSINAREGEAQMEASLDLGSAARRGRSTPISELELELKSGEKEALFAFAARLRRRFDLRPGFITKSERGFALTERNRGPGRHFETPILTSGMSAGAAFRAIALAALEQIAGNAQDLAEARRPEVIHQLRVGVRRLRSALASFEPILADDRFEAIEAELKWLSGELDPARDLDVLLAGAVRRAAREGRESKALAVLRHRLRSRRALAYARARQAAGGERLSALLFDVLAWVEIGPWAAAEAKGARERDGPAARFAARILGDARRQVVKRGHGVSDVDRAKRHKLRIRAKRLRYAVDVLGQLFPAHPKREKAFLDRTKDLVDRLGKLNDIATAERLMAGERVPESLARAEKKREKRLLRKSGRSLRTWRATWSFWPKAT
ncbi:MAG: CYTH and CHAD domain-containing protein [Caulobacteraceae bacterium]